MDALEVLRRKSDREQRARESAEQLLEMKSRELYRANQILMEAKLQAEQASIAKNQFLANMSHEIRTPLNAILGMVELLDDPSLTPVQKERVVVIREAGLLLTSTIDNVLDLGRIEAGAMTIEPIQTDLRRLFDGIISVFRFPVEQKGLTLLSEVDPELPSSLILDATKFKQIVTNLLGNAVKFTHAGHIHCHLSFSADTEPQEIIFTIEDTGIGVSPEKISDIFEPFKQCDNSITRRFGGTGLGLSIANSLVSLLGGTLTLQSEPNVGSTFTMRIPCTKNEVHTDPGTPFPVTDSQHFTRVPQILVIEDNPHNQVVMSGILERLHCRSVIIENGQAALELIRASPQCFDIVLTDLHMPQMGGIEVARRIREMGLSLPIIAMTGDVLMSTRDECLQIGMNGFLSKPFRINSLRDLLLHHLEKLVRATE